jgi:hypothetical protein
MTPKGRDIILRSNDNVDFCDFKTILYPISPVFADKFMTGAQPSSIKGLNSSDENHCFQLEWLGRS